MTDIAVKIASGLLLLLEQEFKHKNETLELCIALRKWLIAMGRDNGN